MVRRACVCIYQVWYGPTEGFKDWKDLKRLDHIEGEDGQVCAFFACVFPVWSDLVWFFLVKILKLSVLKRTGKRFFNHPWELR